MPEKIRLGVVGLGTMGRTYARLAEQNPRVTLAAICDEDADHLEQVEHEHAGAVGYRDYETMLAKGDLDAVVVATPDFAHHAPTIAAAQAGCHLLIEKPLAMDVGEARGMVSAIQKAGVRCQMAFTNRWNPPHVAAHKLIASGELGDILSLNARINNTLATPTEMLKWAARSSPAWFLMVHALDVGRWLSGSEPVSVCAFGVKAKLILMGIDTYDVIHALFRLASGGTLFIESSWVLPRGMPLIFDFKYEVIGSEAAVTVDTHDQGVHLLTSRRLVHPVSLFLERYGMLVGHMQGMFDGFVDAVASDEKPLVDEVDGLRATIAIAAVHESLHSGKPVLIQL